MNSRWIPTLGVLTVLAPPLGAARGASPRHLWDDAGLLSARERTGIERQLTSAERRLASPLYVEITTRLHGESAAQMGERLLAARATSEDARTNPVLLLLAVKDQAGFIATGKGNAGIVPEMDAARIVKKLLAKQTSHGWRMALGGAIDAVIESAEATAERRRPLPPDPGEEPPDPTKGETGDPQGPDADAGGSGDTGLASGGEGRLAGNGLDAGAGISTAATPRPTGGSVPPARSRLPLAIGAAVLFVVALGLRRRKQLTANRAGEGKNPPPPRPRTPPSASGHDPRLGPRGPGSPRR